jgi:hypothetical protein
MHPSQTSLRIALREFADLSADPQGPTAMTPGTTLIAENVSLSVTEPYVYLAIGVDYDNGQFLTRGKDYTVKSNGDGTYNFQLKNPLPYAVNAFYGGASPPDFIVPQGCRTVMISQYDNANPFYLRRGTPNRFGLAIGSEGEANSDDVQGSAVFSKNISSELNEWEPGTPVYLMAETASQIVVVQFNLGQ